MVFCCNIPDLMKYFGITYKTSEWRLFIDSSQRSLKGVLLHNGNKYASIPVAHSVHLKETYENVGTLLSNIKYVEHQWLLCGDFKIICLLLGQQLG